MGDYTSMPLSSPPPPTVPQGWEARWEQGYREWYYINTQTGQSQWEKPFEQFRPPAGPPPTGMSARNGMSQVERLEQQLAAAKLSASSNSLNRTGSSPQPPQAQYPQLPPNTWNQQKSSTSIPNVNSSYEQQQRAPQGYGSPAPYAGASPYGQPPAPHGQLTSSSSQQAPSYGQQAPSYGQNTPSYGQQAPSYTQQAPTYGGAYPSSPPPPAPSYTNMNAPSSSQKGPQPAQPTPLPAPETTHKGLFSKLGAKFGSKENTAGGGGGAPPAQKKHFGTGALLGAGALAIGGTALAAHEMHKHDDHLREEGYEAARRRDYGYNHHSSHGGSTVIIDDDRRDFGYDDCWRGRDDGDVVVVDDDDGDNVVVVDDDDRSSSSSDSVDVDVDDNDYDSN